VVGQGQALRVLEKIFLFERIFPKSLDRPESSALIRPKQGTTDRRMTQEKKKFMMLESLVEITEQGSSLPLESAGDWEW
jgi:hypothetical protein